MRKIKNIISFILSFTLIFVLLCGTEIPVSALQSSASSEKHVRMGYFEFGGMFEGAEKDARKSGYCYEYMMQIATYTGWKYDFVYGSYSELYEKLKTGEIDILPYTNYNNQRGQEVLFSNKVLAQEEYYIALKPEKAASIDSLNGMVISTLEGADYNALLNEYIEKNKLSLDIRYYSSLEETWAAVENGIADATVFTSNAYSNEEWNCFECFGEKPTYIAVAKDKTELLSQLNEATNLIDIDNPAYLGELYEVYFSDNPMRRSLSPEELLWVEEHPVIHVGGFINDAPYLFSVDNESGTATGLTVDVISGIIDRLGLNVKPYYRGYATLEDMEKALDSGEIDVIIPFYPDFSIAGQHNLSISNNVRTSNMELVYLKGTSYFEALKRIATPSTKLGIFYVQATFPDSETVGAISIQDAVDKVHSKEATGAIAQNVVLHNIAEKYDDLNYIVLPEGCDTCFATRPENYLLIRIINRGLKYFSNAEISSIASQYTLEPNVTTMAYLSSHKEAVIMLIIIFIALVALTFLSIQLNSIKKKAEEANLSKSRFLFNMSHDIRTPMNAILGYTDIALNHVGEPERVGDSLRKIKTSGGHLLSLINDILEMSRIEAGKMEIVNAPVNIYEVTESITNMSFALAATKDITFNAEIGELANPYIYSDELHTNQIIINLISNAIKYTNPGGRVDYRIEQLNAPTNGIANYRITVKDNGIGMSEEFQTHLFESFAREHTSTVSKQEGAGLGLAIVKRIVDQIGGTITAKSTQGKGSTFTVELPMKVMDDEAIKSFEASRQTSAEVSADICLEGKKVLLVEDNEMNREIAKELLEEAGLIIDYAEDGAVAVRKVKEMGVHYYDFILMDIQMPVMDGYEATSEIRRLPEGDAVPIIALSANAFEEDKQKSVSAGMNTHIPKPINITELFAALEKFV